MESLKNQTVQGDGRLVRWKMGEKKSSRSLQRFGDSHGFTKSAGEKNGVSICLNGKNMTHDWIVRRKIPSPQFDTPVSKKVPQNKQIPTELSTTSVSGQVFIVGVDCFTFCYFIFFPFWLWLNLHC